MSRVGTRKSRTIEIKSRLLQEHIPIDYYVVGYEEWLLNAFEEDAISSDQLVVIRHGREKEDLKETKSFLFHLEIAGVDTETTGEDKRSGLDPWREGSKLLLLQLGCEEKVFVIQPDLVPFFVDILEAKDILHLGQNLVYDFKYLYVKYGVHMNNLYDTMLAEQLLTSGLNGIRLGLADLARKYRPYRLISKEVRDEFIRFKERGKLISKDMLYYAARDIVLLFTVMTEQRNLLTKWKLDTVAQDEFDLIPVTASMELHGVNIDKDTLRLALSYWEGRQIELEEEILSIYNEEIKKTSTSSLSILPDLRKVFDLNSPTQKLDVLLTMGFDIEDVRRETLETLDSPITKALAEYSNVMKVISTYGENLLRRINPETGHLHPEFHQLGSGDSIGGAKKGTIATGRYSSDFQQMPRPIELYAVVTDIEELEFIKKQYDQEPQQLQLIGGINE
jgi:DNA polymerase-1